MVVFLAITSRHTVPAKFLNTIIPMVQYNASQNIKTWVYNDLDISMDVSRNKCVEKFFETDADWLFFLDTDTFMEPNTIELLLNHGKKIIGGIYTSRHEPYLPIAYKKVDGKLTPITEIPNKIFQVDALATGCLLIHKSVFEKMKKPYFEYEKDANKERILKSEDVFFCEKAKKEGFEIFADPSIKVWHYGSVADLELFKKFKK
ncbi:MAG: hypothetical protein CL944_01520 [Candidatus Diapherotrites archaeon]|uniref:Glycosyltransferase 2-like domain-containing protein n=1 Tax=Candidatus Iainarchaeum sp. TaxID=3101447 RepID=A0A2D6LPN3_9ARCH|nr:hypothetical protein [Candidatus Diapherotrites archaeon]|tara:strand:- start:3274 stop:3885 length:612 start_codon:yes stop_codon:yes gene_type:complete